MSDPNQPLPAAGWYRDPTGQGEARYWTGTAWTATISRGGVSFQSPMVPDQIYVPPVPGSEFVARAAVTPPQVVISQPAQPQKSSFSTAAIIGVIVAVAAIIALIVVLASAGGGDKGDNPPPATPPATQAPPTTNAP